MAESSLVFQENIFDKDGGDSSLSVGVAKVASKSFMRPGSMRSSNSSSKFGTSLGDNCWLY